MVAFSAAFIGLVVATALLGPLIAPYAPDAQHLRSTLSPPTGEFLLGTDHLGRDVLSRVMLGAWNALVGPLVVAVGAALLSTPLALAAGYRGGWLDGIVMRCVDFMFALPALLVATVLVGLLGGGYWMAVAFLVVIATPEDIRVIRGASLVERVQPYVEAAKLLGLSERRILFQHILPNVLPLIVASVFLRFAFAQVSLAALSYLGLGVGPAAADWGRMLNDGRAHIFSAPLVALVPGILIVVTSAAMNVIGDYAYERHAGRDR
jgi:peptide/nickel transport system permease protein